MNLDKTDIQILDILQEDASKPVADIAARVGLSVTPCWRRIQKLEETVSSDSVSLCWMRKSWGLACRCLWRLKLISIMQTG